MIRPSMKACDTDVLATTRNAGFELKVLMSYSEKPIRFRVALIM